VRTFKAVHVRILLATTALGACVESHAEAPGETCRLATSLRDRALDDALATQPACVEDADCLLLMASVQCDDVLQLGDCGRPAHRAALAHYAAAKVNERVCEAVQGAEFGCSVLPLCSAGGTAACSAGQCVFAQP
jgi:hypothetical protein